MSVPGQRHGALERVPDLSAVPHGADGRTLALLRLEERLGVVNDVARVEVDEAARVELVEVRLPDPAGVLPREGRVVQREVEAGLEGLVEDADAVAGEEEDAFVVFEGAEED